MSPTFISRFAFSHLEICFGPKETWASKYSGPIRPTAYKLRDSLRSKFSPVQSLPENSRLRNHIMNSGNNSRMNTIMDELASYSPPKRYIKIGIGGRDLLDCCGASKHSFYSSALSFLKKEERAEDIEKALIKKLTKGWFAQIDSDPTDLTTKGPRASGLFLFVPYWLHKKYGDVFIKAGFHLSIVSEKHESTAIYFKDVTSVKQARSIKTEPFTLPEKVNPEICNYLPGRKSVLHHGETDCYVIGYNGFNEETIHGSQIEAIDKENSSASIEILILRTRNMEETNRRQIETHFANAIKHGFTPMTPDGQPYLNGNYPSCKGKDRHWLMPMARLNPKVH